MKPSVGRIVHFYDDTLLPSETNGVGHGPYTAMVTQLCGVDSEGNVTYVNLKVFPPFGEIFDAGSVSEQAEDGPYLGRSWRWPPRS